MTGLHGVIQTCPSCHKKTRRLNNGHECGVAYRKSRAAWSLTPLGQVVVHLIREGEDYRGLLRASRIQRDSHRMA